MWNCRKCSKPVFFAERKQSLGFDWHPNCLRCEECGKRLNPGQHAEHKGVPFCHHPCYGALFGPHLFGHGTRNECHTSFGKVENRDGQVKRSHLESQLKIYNSFYEGKPGELKSREINGRLILEGVLRIYWGVKNTIHFKEEDDSRMIATRRQNSLESKVDSCYASERDYDLLWREDDPENSRDWNRESTQSKNSADQSAGSPEGDHHSNAFVEDNGERTWRHVNGLGGAHETTNTSTSLNNNNLHHVDNSTLEEKQERLSNRTGSTAIRRRPGRRMEKTKIKRRCSINGHFYLRETSSFTPPYASGCSIWITSKTTAEEVLNMLLDKYKVEMSSSNFALFIVKDNGELRRIRQDESPLVTRVMLGPHEEVAKVFIMDAQLTHEVSHEVAQFLNLSLTECRAILTQYEQEEMKYLKAIRKKYEKLRCFIQSRLNSCTTEIIISEKQKNCAKVC